MKTPCWCTNAHTIYTHADSCTHTIYIHTNSCAYTHAYGHVHICIRTYNSLAHTCPCVHTRMHISTHIHTHTQAYNQINAHLAGHIATEMTTFSVLGSTYTDRHRAMYAHMCTWTAPGEMGL